MESPSASRASTSFPETLFVLGGTVESDDISSAVFGFNTVEKRWTQYPDLLKARACHRAVFAEAEKSILIVGGSDTWPSAGFGECEMLMLGDVQQESGDAANDSSWQPLPHLIRPRSCHGLCYFRSLVFACGGMMNPDLKLYSRNGIDEFDLTNSCEFLDVSQLSAGDEDIAETHDAKSAVAANCPSKRWQEFASLNLPRFGLQLLTVSFSDAGAPEGKSFLVAIGGRGPDHRAEYSIEALQLDDSFQNRRWQLLDTFLLAPRIDFAAAVVAGDNAKTIDVIILGGNRVTREERTDSSRSWEVLRLSLGDDNQISAEVFAGGRLPSSRVGCRATVLKHLVEGREYLAVAGGFKAWGEGQRTYGGPIDQSVALLELKSGADDDSSTQRASSSWVDFSSSEGIVRGELEKLPIKLRQPAVCVAEA